ncbi:ATP-binding protein [Azospirillum sp. SYSU D00513]|uniref:ATP-binding protein n=1 Tax=Azospirillum sp. SYSU D00513 TaxID=2812561 RepID=UPI001A971F86|nr:ATP-binding protein [Azospirillum sp. SYSU D00513]
MKALVMMRRWIPDSIAARMALTVVLALLLTQAISAAVYITDRNDGPSPHGPRVLLQRITAIVQLVESTPAPGRQRLVGAIDDPFLRVEWSEKRSRFGAVKEGFPFDMMARRLRDALNDPARPVVVEVRRDPVPPPIAVEPERPRWNENVRLSVRLADGSWLSFTGGDPLEGPFRLMRFALWMGAVLLVILLLSVWAARRLTAPLAGFATAAERLGVDPEAPPLPESGPRELRVAIRAFNRMQGRLARFVADRTQMMAAISHDLRTPLTRLRLRAELVEDPEMQRKMLSDLDEMEAMVTATLAFARDDAKREPRGPLDLADLLQSLCEDRVDAGHEAAYEGPAHATIDGRPVALRRAFANLMDNAIAYGGGCAVRLLPEEGQIRVVIEDEGPGIPEEEFEKVFAPFYRLERSRSRDTGGVGLGLSTARTVLRGHGGDVALENRAEGGLRVTVTLPR